MDGWGHLQEMRKWTNGQRILFASLATLIALCVGFNNLLRLTHLYVERRTPYSKARRRMLSTSSGISSDKKMFIKSTNNCRHISLLNNWLAFRLKSFACFIFIEIYERYSTNSRKTAYKSVHISFKKYDDAARRELYWSSSRRHRSALYQRERLKLDLITWRLWLRSIAERACLFPRFFSIQCQILIHNSLWKTEWSIIDFRLGIIKCFFFY